MRSVGQNIKDPVPMGLMISKFRSLDGLPQVLQFPPYPKDKFVAGLSGYCKIPLL